MRRKSWLKNILLLLLLLMSFSCVKRVLVPDPDCKESLREKDIYIEQLLDEIDFKDNQLRDCLRMLRD